MYNGIDSSPRFIGCTFLENLASGTQVQGGGMYNWTGSPTYTGCQFVDNQASGTQSCGGGMFNRESAPIVIETTFSHNFTEYQGGGIYNIQGTPTFASCTIADNQATGTRSSGGGMFNSEYPCLEPGSGPAIGSRWSYAVNYTCNEMGVSGLWFTLSNDTVWDYMVTGTEMFNGNLTYVSDAEINGDAQRRYPYPGGVTPPMDIPVTLFGPIENRGMGHHELIREEMPLLANAMGGINMDLVRAYDYIGRPSNLSLNSAWSYQTEVDLPTFAFHEEMTWNAQVTGIENITVPLGTFECYKVEANGTGGALPDATNTFWWSVDENLPVPVKYIENYQFLGTETFELSMYAPYGEIYNCGFSGNTAVLAGGGMTNAEDSCPAITRCVFTGNQATGNESLGGGMFNESAFPTVMKNTFSGNGAVDGGGMFNLQSQTTIGKSIFESNLVTRNGGGIANMNSDAIISDCSFWYNSGTNGGGVYNLMSDPAIDKSHFNGNTVNQYGGGMYNDESSPTVTNSRFATNTAEFGGGMYNVLGLPLITNCTFFANQAIGIGMNGDGGGVDNYQSLSVITNCTFYGNFASSNGGGIFNYDCAPTITNCILWGDTCGDIGDEIRNASANPSLTYSNVQGGYPGIGNINGTPMFVNPGSGDFHLLPTSTCIDSGSNSAIQATGITQDFEGDARIMGDTVDMGVDETVPTWDPWIYDTNHNWKIEYSEMVEALMDYLIGNITYAQMVEVLMLYLTT